MFPESAARMVASSASGCSASRAVACMTKPGVQKPHWKAKLSQKACCSGFIAPSGPAMPSMVVTSVPRACTANMRQDRTG